MELQGGDRSKSEDQIAFEKLRGLHFNFLAYAEALKTLAEDTKIASQHPESIGRVSDVVIAHASVGHERLFEAMTDTDGRTVVIDATEVHFTDGNIRGDFTRLDRTRVAVRPTALLGYDTSSCGDAVIVAAEVDEQPRYFEIHGIVNLTS